MFSKIIYIINSTPKYNTVGTEHKPKYRRIYLENITDLT